MKKFLVSIFIFPIFFFSFHVVAFAYSSPGVSSGYVTDFADILSEEIQVSLENKLQEFSASTSIEIAVVTVNSLEGDSIESYANQLFREWGIGKKEYNNGILFIVAPNDRKTRIEVGYGLEGVMPDIQAGYIIDNIIIPQFKNSNYEDGVVNGTNAILNVVKGEKFEPVSNNMNSDTLATILVFGIFIFIFVVQGIMALLASTKSWWLGGIFGVLVGWMMASLLQIPGYDWLPSIILGISGLIFDYVISKSYKKYLEKGGTKSAWSWGGNKLSRGGRFGGGGSRGGFGGGSSGGGGASGGW